MKSKVSESPPLAKLMLGISCWWITLPLSRSDRRRQREGMVSCTLVPALDKVTLSPSMLWIFLSPLLLPSLCATPPASHTLLMHSLAMADLVSKSSTFMLVLTSTQPMYLTHPVDALLGYGRPCLKVQHLHAGVDLHTANVPHSIVDPISGEQVIWVQPAPGRFSDKTGRVGGGVCCRHDNIMLLPYYKISLHFAYFHL